ncbi:hypothetical protein [uncultured Duncaniella sp.]|uniref:hypothetical protein n=4 Tax=uncultured Duncaniella sp. TaxID=2768039 RepID=UPI0025A943D7|nr:hypothetical protein [uncultured Duncaniella sp.]
MTNPIKTSITIIIATLCSLLSACGSTEASRVLGEIEDYMYAHPDTRLDDLMDIDSAILSRTADRMLYEVLLTQAIDKAHGSLATRDSVMQVAADWFTGRSDTRHALLANYFLGRVKFEKEDYPESLVAMFKAHDLAKELDDKFWIGMSARGIADVYNNRYNTGDGVHYSEIELENLRLAGRQPYINYAMLDLANTYCNNRDYEKTYEICRQLTDSANKYSDTYLYSEAQKTIAVTLMTETKFEKSIPYMQSAAETGLLSTKDSAFLAFALGKIGKNKDAVAILNNINNNDVNYWLKYEINDNLGNTDSAFNYLKKEYENLNAQFRERISLDLSSTLANYYEMSRHLKEKKLKTSQIFNYLLVTIIALIIVIGALIVNRYYKAYEYKIERNMAIAQSLRETLAIKKSEYDIARTAIREKMRNEFSILDELCQKVYESENPTAARKRVSAVVTDLIEQLSGDKKKIENLERMVDRNCDNVISDFKTDFPNLKNADYNLFLYSILGFSINSISLFLKEEKLTSVYERKRRLKDKIKKLEPIKRDKYLNVLG